MDKKDKILQAALKLFNIYGFDNTPTSKISKEAGVATGTLFNYFESKQELINVLYLNCKDSLKVQLASGVQEESTFRGKLKRIYFNFMGWSLNHSQEFLFFQQFSNSTHIVAKTREEGFSKLHEFMELISEGVKKEIIKDVQVEYMSVLLAGLLFSNAQYYIANPHLGEDEAFLELSFNFIWDSIRR